MVPGKGEDGAQILKLVINTRLSVENSLASLDNKLTCTACWLQILDPEFILDFQSFSFLFMCL